MTTVKRAFVCLLIMSIIQGSPALGAIQHKVGGNCTKLGVTQTVKNLKLICIKRKGKLIWQRVSIKESANPLPSVEPNPSSTSNSKIYSAIPYNNFKDITARAMSKSDTKYEFNAVINESMDLRLVNNIEKRYRFSINFWQEVLGGQNFYVIFGNNDDILWVKNQLEKISPYKYDDWYKNFMKNMPGAKCDSYAAGAYGGHKDFYLQSFTLYSNSCSEIEPRDDNFRTTVEHELTHAAQIGFTKDQNHLLPCWFKEGHAQYFGALLGNSESYENFLKSRAYPFQRFSTSNFSDSLKRLDEKYDNFRCGTDGGYTVGSLAVENLLSISSHETINQFMIDTGITKNWRSAFQLNFKIDFDTWASNLNPETV